MYVQVTGQEIPVIVISCIRIINLYGNLLVFVLNFLLWIQQAFLNVMINFIYYCETVWCK